ncbi:MAG: YkgJ family cysteine cluster protein [Fibrobacter sp.]|nr:YkgJ family cysteine cluster protein [Fibrobacter sp.]
MTAYREYFPTKAFRIAEMRLSSVLGKERDRLDSLAASLGRECAIGPDNLVEQLPLIRNFTREYHRLFSEYLDAVLPQQPRPIQCRPACGNCCHHYPMSVEPFELLTLYGDLRGRTDLLDIMEACQVRSSLFSKFFEDRRVEAEAKQAEGDSSCKMDVDDEAEDKALHDYFSAWNPCPFSDKKGDCTVYPLRPVSCRMYFSETDPKFCTPEHLQTPENDSYIVYLPDAIEDAVYGISEHYSLLELPESYFGGLLAVNKFEGLMGGVAV